MKMKSCQKEEFVPHSIDPEEAEAYWVALFNEAVPPTEVTYPSKPRVQHDYGLPSKRSFPFLDTMREFCRVPGEVEFRIPKLGESAENPLEDYFTCYEAHLVRCHLWFPIPEVIIHILNRFGLSISQVTLMGLQHLIGILVLSYEQGMVLDADYFKALLQPHQSLGRLMYHLTPRKYMSIVKKTISVEFCLPEAGERYDSPPHGYFTCYDTHMLRCCLWFPISEIIFQVLDRFRFLLSHITHAGLQHLVGILILSYERGMTLDADYLETLIMPVVSKKSEIYRLKPRGLFRTRMDFEKSFFYVRLDSSSVDESFIPIFRTRWSRKAYHRTRLQSDQPVEEESKPSMGEFIPCDVPVLRDISRSPKNKQVAVDDGDNAGIYLLTEAVKTSRTEARTAQFKAEVTEKEITRLREEATFLNEFGEFKKTYNSVGDYHECHSTIGGLYLTQVPRYSYDDEVARQNGHIRRNANMDFAIPHIKNKIWDQWDPIPVSVDSEEIGTEVPCETGEVNQPVAPANDYSFGRSMSGFNDPSS
ncbi:hypothetical protein N665_0194s0019 [Sinapis alba]|nr:hypothetical protein N665_0194s0019 [Sinapis alba]